MPQQLFDFAHQIAREQSAPEPKSPAPIAVLDELPPIELTDDEREQEKTDYQLLEKFVKNDSSYFGEDLLKNGPQQMRLVRALPPEFITSLVRVMPPRTLWPWLLLERRPPLSLSVMRGFQNSISTLRNQVVRSRIAKFLEDESYEIWSLLQIWSRSEPKAPVLVAVSSHQSDIELRKDLPFLIQTHGLEMVAAALAIGARERVMAVLGDISPEEIENAKPPEPTIAPEPPPKKLSPEEEIAILRKQLAKAMEAVESGKRLFDVIRSLEADFRDLKEELAQSRTREAKTREKYELKIANLENRHRQQLEELKKHDERTTRKLRATERHDEEIEAENRRLKKQVRNGQQIAEELRKQLSNLEAQAHPKTAEVEREAPQIVAQPAKPLSPLDEVFEWRADGRSARVVPRAVRRLIDKNDEDAVFTLIQSLDGLAEVDPSLRGKFLKRMREAGPHYERVLTCDTTRVLVDASNVARYETNQWGKGILENLYSMREELRRLDCFPILFYADASLPYFIDEPHKLKDMILRGEILMANKGQEADEILAREARRTGAYVVTNDAKFFHKVSPDFEPPRISFRIFSGTVIIDDF